MSKLTELITALRGLELPPSAASLLGSISNEATALEVDRDDAVGKLKTRQDENAKLKERAQTAESERDGLKAKLPDGTVILSKEDATEYEALRALGKPAKDLKTTLEQAATDRATALQAGNEKALSLLGLRPDVLELRKFDGAVFTASKDGDKVTASVKQGDKDVPYETWVTEQGLTDTLKNFAVAPLGVPVLGQVTGDRTSAVSGTTKTVQDLQAARDAVPNPLLPKPNPT